MPGGLVTEQSPWEDTYHKDPNDSGDAGESGRLCERGDESH